MSPQEVYSGYVLFGNRPHAVYSLLSHIEPGLMLDVGAAAGVFTKIMLSRSPESRVMAFEPFPGNFAYFEKNVGQDPRVALNKAAVSDDMGMVSFFVSSVVRGTEPGWESYAGYSSLGHIVEENSQNVSSSIKVPSVRLDEIISEHVRFCKIDVQGGEARVLRGADEVIRKWGVDVFYVEFGGEESILEYLEGHGYVFFDNAYLLVATRSAPSEEQWIIEKSVALSTGKEAYEAWPRCAPRSFGDYCTWLKEQKKQIGNVQTDMVCVHRSFIPEFLEASSKAIRVGMSDGA